MRFRALIVVLVLLGTVGLADAQELMITQDPGGCQLYAPYAWVEIPGGGTWTAEVDLRECSMEQLGWFWVYGYITTGTKSDALKIGDKVVVSAEAASEGVRHTFDAKSPQTQIMLMMPVAAPTKILLRATNESRKKKKIRLTWLNTEYQF